MNLKTTFGCATLVLASIVSGTAIASDTATEPPMSAVSFADLNLNSAAGVATLYRRIEHAANQVCDYPRETRQIKITVDLRTCKARATERAVLQVGSPALSALHVSRTGRVEKPVQVADQR
jgi:UrcA family protein